VRALYLKAKLAFSDLNFQKARLALLQTYSGQQARWQPIIWYKEPSTGEGLDVPPPVFAITLPVVHPLVQLDSKL